MCDDTEIHHALHIESQGDNQHCDTPALGECHVMDTRLAASGMIQIEDWAWGVEIGGR